MSSIFASAINVTRDLRGQVFHPVDQRRIDDLILHQFENQTILVERFEVVVEQKLATDVDESKMVADHVFQAKLHHGAQQHLRRRLIGIGNFRPVTVAAAKQ